MKGIISYGLFSDISKACNRLISPAIVATVTKFCTDGIQEARQLDAGDTKDAIKNKFSITSSAASAIGIGGSVLSFFGTMLTSNVWNNLNNKQRIGITVTFVVGLGLSAYSLSRFGIEQNTGAAGYNAASAMFLMNSAEYAARKSAENEIEKRGDLNEPLSHTTYTI